MATLKNSIINDTGYFTLPAGTTAQRPGSPTQGMTRYNTTLGYVEWYDAGNATWRPIYQAPNVSVDYLVVAGAGGAGHGAGGSGVVILKISNGYTATFSVGITSTVDSSSVPGYKIYRVTAGTGTVTFS